MEKVMFRNRVIMGNALDVLKQVPDGYVSCIVTSPPYFHQRRYGAEFNWGGDPKCRHEWGEIRKLRITGGTSESAVLDRDGWRMFESESSFCIRCGCWHGELGLEPTIELYLEHLLAIMAECRRVLREDGTCWVNIADKYSTGSGAGRGTGKRATNRGSRYSELDGMEPVPGLPRKSLCCIPERFVLGMLEQGWIVRSRIAWVKGISFCETYAGTCMPESAADRPNKNGWEFVYFFTKSGDYWFEQQFEDGTCGRRIWRNAWAVNQEPSDEEHYAVFPMKLVRPMIRAGCPARICAGCGRPDGGCGCNAGFAPGIVLDPFGGTFTVGAAAVRLGRDYLMIEAKPEYAEQIGRLRLTEAETGVAVSEQRGGQSGLYTHCSTIKGLNEGLNEENRKGDGLWAGSLRTG